MVVSKGFEVRRVKSANKSMKNGDALFLESEVERMTW